jgi:hypothetical protein
MRTCHCTNQCPGCGTCCQIACGCRRVAGGWTSPNTGPLPLGRTHREPLTEEQVRQIIREELKRARGKS